MIMIIYYDFFLYSFQVHSKRAVEVATYRICPLW